MKVRWNSALFGVPQNYTKYVKPFGVLQMVRKQRGF